MAGLGGGGSGNGGGDDGGTLILEGTVEGMVDYKGMQAVGSKTGGWRSAVFVIRVEIAERLAFNGIASNLITYLTGPLHQPTAHAAVNINAWSGVVSLLPLIGVFVADSYLGRYRMILYSSLLYVGGLGLLTLSALLPSLSHLCQDIKNNSCSPPQFQVILFFISLYVVAIAQGGHKPCAQAFAADQFNSQDPRESESRRSFFNWWLFGPCVGSIFCFTVLDYIQDNVNWTLGFGIPSISMGVALIVFILGKKTYRYSVKDKQNPFMQIGLVFVIAAKNWRHTIPPSDTEEESIGSYSQFKFLDKALINVCEDQDDLTKNRTVCTRDQVNDANSILRLIPIWFTCLVYAIVIAQVPTFFTKQGSTLDRSLGLSFQIPPASLLTFIGITIVLFIPIYDLLIVPIARVFTKKPSGITMLQRVGFGMIICMIAMVVAALVEKKRLRTALDFDLINKPDAMVPMSIWWLLPQYFLIGVADAFLIIGLQEFFYDQIPNGLRSLGIALYCSVIGIGSFLSGFLISVIDKVSGNDGHSWFSNNLNQGHLDYFYWFLAGLNGVGFVSYLHFARLYVYNRQNSTRGM